MTSMPCGVISYHTDPITCGVARFNVGLAAAFNVPVIGFDKWIGSDEEQPLLLSLKPSEISATDLRRAMEKLETNMTAFSAFLHEFENTPLEQLILSSARRVVAVDRLIAAKAKLIHDEVVEGFAPGVNYGIIKEFIGVRLLSLGMAHKLNGGMFGVLSKLLERESRGIELRVSTAVHEGFAIGESFAHVSDLIKKNWTLPVKFLGFISDALLGEELAKAHAVVIFPMQSARESNSSILGAMRSGKPVITWLDENSPSWMVHQETVFDVNSMSTFPSSSDLIAVGRRAAAVCSDLDFASLKDLFL